LGKLARTAINSLGSIHESAEESAAAIAATPRHWPYNSCSDAF
jgi:hypothetical protein